MSELEKKINQYPKAIQLLMELVIALILLGIPTLVVSLITEYSFQSVAEVVMLVYLFLVVYRIGSVLVWYALKWLY